jgi:hypothetical protein
MLRGPQREADDIGRHERFRVEHFPIGLTAAWSMVAADALSITMP